jgi:hypothetical protein
MFSSVTFETAAQFFGVTYIASAVVVALVSKICLEIIGTIEAGN